MSDWLGKITKKGIERWVTYSDKNTGLALYPPKPEKDETKKDVLAAFLKKGGTSIVQGEGSRYKVEIDGVSMFYDDAILPTLPPAGSSGLFNISSFNSKGKTYFTLVGMADAELAMAQLAILAARQLAARNKGVDFAALASPVAVNGSAAVPA